MPILTIQPPSIDSHNAQATPDANKGSLTQLIVQATSGGRANVLLRFDFTSLPAGVTINAATLSLYNYDRFDSAGRSYGCYRITQTGWTELGNTWNKYDGTNNWTTAGGDFTATDAAFANVPSSNGWQAWDVQAQVEYARASVSDIAHFLINDAIDLNAWIRYYSREYAGGPTLRPKLVIDYTEAGTVTPDMWQPGIQQPYKERIEVINYK